MSAITWSTTGHRALQQSQDPLCTSHTHTQFNWAAPDLARKHRCVSQLDTCLYFTGRAKNVRSESVRISTIEKENTYPSLKCSWRWAAAKRGVCVKTEGVADEYMAIYSRVNRVVPIMQPPKKRPNDNPEARCSLRFPVKMKKACIR